VIAFGEWENWPYYSLAARAEHRRFLWPNEKIKTKSGTKQGFEIKRTARDVAWRLPA